MIWRLKYDTVHSYIDDILWIDMNEWWRKRGTEMKCIYIGVAEDKLEMDLQEMVQCI